MPVDVFDLNYANLKKLSDLDLVKLMLSPHTSYRLMDLLKWVYKNRLLNVADAEKIVDGCTVNVDCTFQDELEMLDFGVELLEAY